MQKQLREVLRTHDSLLELSNQGDKGLDQARDLASEGSNKAFTDSSARWSAAWPSISMAPMPNEPWPRKSIQPP